jgi:hypothetical protein
MIQMIGRTLLSMCEQTFGHSYQMFQACKVPSEAGLRNCDKANILWSTGAIKGEEGLPVLGKTEERCYREDIQMQSLIKDPFTNFGATGSLCCVTGDLIRRTPGSGVKQPGVETPCPMRHGSGRLSDPAAHVISKSS